MVLSLGSYLGVSCHACRLITKDELHHHQQTIKLEADRQVVVGTPEDVLSLIVHRFIHPHLIRMLVIDDADALLSGSFLEHTLKVN